MRERWRIWFDLKMFPEKITFIFFVSFIRAWGFDCKVFIMQNFWSEGNCKFLSYFYFPHLFVDIGVYWICLKAILHTWRDEMGNFATSSTSLFITLDLRLLTGWVSSQGYFWALAKTYNFFMRWDAHNKTETTLLGQSIKSRIV